MQDEHFMRDWAASHHHWSRSKSSSDQPALDRTRKSRKKSEVIGGPYADSPIGDGMTHLARASLRGLAATATTFVLWMTVMVLATPAEGLALPLADAVDCGASPILA